MLHNYFTNTMVITNKYQYYNAFTFGLDGSFLSIKDYKQLKPACRKKKPK